jgi:predicted transposase YdaD
MIKEKGGGGTRAIAKEWIILKKIREESVVREVLKSVVKKGQEHGEIRKWLKES